MGAAHVEEVGPAVAAHCCGCVCLRRTGWTCVTCSRSSTAMAAKAHVQFIVLHTVRRLRAAVIMCLDCAQTRAVLTTTSFYLCELLQITQHSCPAHVQMPTN